MRNLVLAGVAGLLLSLGAGAAYAIPDTAQIMNHGQSADQGAVGAYQASASAAPAPVYFAPATQDSATANPAWRNGVSTGLGLQR